MQKDINWLLPYNRPKNISWINFFKTKQDLQEAFLYEKIYEIAWTIIKKRNTWWVEEYIESLKKLDYSNSFWKGLFEYMVLNTIPEAVLIKKQFNINEKLPANVFISWLSMDGAFVVFDHPLFLDFFDLCSEPEKLVYEIWKLWYIWKAYSLAILKEVNVIKYNEEDSKQILEKFKNFVNSFSFTKKAELYGYYDWNQVCAVLFEDYNEAFTNIWEIFQFSEEEKKIIDEDKKKFLENYEEFKDILKEDIEKLNHHIIGEYEFDTEHLTNEKLEEKRKQFLKFIKGKIEIPSVTDSILVVFVNMVWQNMVFTISNASINLWYDYNFFEKENFYQGLQEMFEQFKNDFERNNLDFSIIVAKNNKDKDDVPDETEYRLAA